VQEAGDVLLISMFTLLWRGTSAPGRRWAWSGLDPAGSEGTSGTNALMKCRRAWRRQWTQKSDWQVLTIKTETSQ